MADSKKRRMSMLDSLSGTGNAPPAGAMMSSNRALRSARDAVDAHNVWDLDPAQIDDDRFADRLDPSDVQDLRTSIEQNGQTVPILVRRHPSEADRYLLVYGRRRLEAIKGSERTARIRALIANLDDAAALKAQVSENTGRRDLSYIERALFAYELLESQFGNQTQIAEVLNVTRSAVSMAIALAKAIDPALARAIGPAHGVGRPRWEALAKDMSAANSDQRQLCSIAKSVRNQGATQDAEKRDEVPDLDTSVVAFEAVSKHVKRQISQQRERPRANRTVPLIIGGKPVGSAKKTDGAIRLDLKNVDDGFALWLAGQAQSIVSELHDRWKRDV
ncbi:MAG: plasmid partitioning protein RepB [Paracoccus hibiscisoli]|uniref:plasmid partitioning protein RepB n=1 Tax=Paracoccus hibiscisoli TaxID=2023261 RepID=UPI00391908AE